MAEESLGFNVWSERDLGVDTFATKTFDSVSDADIEYCSNSLYPFVQLVNANTVFGEELPLNFVTTSTGWVIHDYGEAISASAPYSVDLKKSATSVLDQAKTAEEIMRLIAEKGWTSVEVIAGTEFIKRFVWVEAKVAEIDLVGYTPSVVDERCYARLAKYFEEIKRKKYLRSKVQLQEGAATAA